MLGDWHETLLPDAVNGQAYKGKGKKELPASPFDVPIPLAGSLPAHPASNAASGSGTVGKADSFSFQPGASRISESTILSLLSPTIFPVLSRHSINTGAT